MFQVSHLDGFGAAAPASAAVTRTFAAATADTSDASTYTFTGHAIGTAAANRKVVVCVATNILSSASISSVTVGGNAATEAIGYTGLGACGIWIIDVAAGTTATIVVNTSTGAIRCGISVYAMYGAASSTPTATGTDATDVFSASINVSAGGVAFGIATSNNAGTFTWTGLTEDNDTAYGDDGGFSAASGEFASAQTPLAITADWSAGSSTPGSAFASFA